MRPSLVASLALLLIAPLLATAHAAEEPPEPEAVPTALVVTSEPTQAGESAELRVALARADTADPVAGGVVVVRRWTGERWGQVRTLSTDASGQAVADVLQRRKPARNRFRLSYAGSQDDVLAYAPSSAEHAVRLVRRPTTVTLRAPKKVVDERSVRLRVRWRADDGTAVSGRVEVRKRVKGSHKWRRWRTVRVITTGSQGRAGFKVTPRRTTRWRLVGRRNAWAAGDRSPVHRLRNVPPAPRVVLPQGAPRPWVTLPKQRRAVGKGANPVVRRIGDPMWRRMVGRSWHRGCPVGRSGLRVVELNYFGFDGYRRRGRMVVAAGATGNFVGAFADLYAARIPVRSMYPVDRLGWSRNLGGADDYRSMAADNTSVFNCRGVVGNPSVRSPHSYGRSLDLNPWQNPYRSRQGWTPNSWWASRSHPRVAWTSGNHRVVKILQDNGFRWTYGTSDQHHFDAVGNNRALRGLLSSQACLDDVCH